ncbi:MAG: hypothetical protein DRP57_02805 [Spirochaetes bacterium]|nr:MAG: hypothetical protein DRP57_02805 [Spirochaetota bacterium]
MNHKRITIMVLSALILAGTGMGLMASGQSENTQQTTTQTQWQRGRSGRPGYMMANSFAKENAITVTGKLYYQSTLHPEIKTDKAEYELLVPRYLIFDAGIKEGTEVSVSGYKVENPPMERDKDESNDIHIYVTKATINGKTYDIASEREKYRMQRNPRYAYNGRPRTMQGKRGGNMGRSGNSGKRW